MKIIVDHLTYKYNEDTNNVVTSLDDINIVINENEFVAIIGETGSGKSTLVQQLNAILKPSSGTVYFNGEDIFEKGYDKRALRGKVGLVFQYPENQLFSETVFEDVCFGPKNVGMTRKQAELKAYEALKLVGIEDECFYQSPFELSGGQKRKVAIAGVLAMHPEVLILDEPTAGLDPKSKKELLDCIRAIKEKENMIVILVSHCMEDIAEYADRVIVLNKGKVVLDDSCIEVFKNYEVLEANGLRAPETFYIMKELKQKGINIDVNAFTVDDAVERILESISR